MGIIYDYVLKVITNEVRVLCKYNNTKYFKS